AGKARIGTQMHKCRRQRRAMQGEDSDEGILRRMLAETSERPSAGPCVVPAFRRYVSRGLGRFHPSLATVAPQARDYLTQDCGEPLDSIVCYGQSLGSVPSIDLASRCCLGGVILHSALASGLRVIHEDLQTTPWFDIFKNVVKIADVQCPVFVIHGNQDLEVPIEHGRALHEACPPRFAAEPWWVQEAGHHDIETHWRSMYLRKLQLFLRSLAPVEQEDSEGQPFT
ncbi:unnamed protein product, partial [Prorocentrum cordatum]